jgi:hypothetical protein
LEAVGLKTNILTKIFYQTLIRLVIYWYEYKISFINYKINQTLANL